MFNTKAVHHSLKKLPADHMVLVDHMFSTIVITKEHFFCMDTLGLILTACQKTQQLNTHLEEQHL